MNTIRQYKNSINIATLCFLIAVTLITPISGAQALESAASREYTVLAPLPCVPSNTVTCPGGDGKLVDKVTFQTYIQNAINLLIGLAAVAAVFMIVWGGLQYMTTTVVNGKSEGLKKVENAIYGLLLVLCSYLILRTIDPRLVQIPTTLVPKIELKGELTRDAMKEFFNQLEIQKKDIMIDTTQLLQNIQNGKTTIEQAQKRRQELCDQLNTTSKLDGSNILLNDNNAPYKDPCYAFLANPSLLGRDSQAIAIQIANIDNQINQVKTSLIAETNQVSSLNTLYKAVVKQENNTNTSASLSVDMEVIETVYQRDLIKLKEYGPVDSAQKEKMEDYKNYSLGMLQMQKDIVDGPSTWSKAIGVIPAAASIIKNGAVGIFAGPTVGGMVASQGFTKTYVDAHQQALANKINSNAIERYGNAIKDPAIKNKFMEIANGTVASIKP